MLWPYKKDFVSDFLLFIQDMCDFSGLHYIKLKYVQPASQQQNDSIELFNRTVRYEWLSQYYWSNFEEV
ncbi:MAG: hypothetical protein EBZ61_10340 [Micrococcales bacterium]|nr:hypothetical protein [Micrococcales bacterium]